MTLVSLIAIYVLLTVMPLFMVEITAHRTLIDLSWTVDSSVMKWLTHREFEMKVTNGSKTVGNNTYW